MLYSGNRFKLSQVSIQSSPQSELRLCWIEGTKYGQGSTLRSPSGLETAHCRKPAHTTAVKTGLGETPLKGGSPEE
jgi:hypothetical protein